MMMQEAADTITVHISMSSKEFWKETIVERLSEIVILRVITSVVDIINIFGGKSFLHKIERSSRLGRAWTCTKMQNHF